MTLEEAKKCEIPSIREYIEQAAHRTPDCPFCGGDGNQGQGGFVEIQFDLALQEIKCTSCGKSWRAVYRLNDIEGIDD